MRYPFTPFKTDTKFGAQAWYGPHEGLDINGLGGGNTDCGTPLYPIFDGEIIHTSESSKDYGNLIVFEITGPWGVRWVRYAHCQSFLKKSGSCRQDEAIALMGSTGNSTACHLHFDILKKRPTRWRYYTKDQQLFAEYFDDPGEFIERWKNYKPVAEVKPYEWLEGLARENSVSIKNIEGWIREALDKAAKQPHDRDALIKCETVKKEMEQDAVALAKTLHERNKEVLKLTTALESADKQIKVLKEELKEANKPLPVIETRDNTPTTSTTINLSEGGDDLMNQQTKPWYQSTTLWVNIIGVLVLLIEAIASTDLVNPQTVTILLAIANVLNRFRAPVEVKKLSIM